LAVMRGLAIAASLMFALSVAPLFAQTPAPPKPEQKTP